MKLTEKEKQKRAKLAARSLNKKVKKQFSRSKLIEEADRVFSLYIRGRDAGKPCCTCWAAWQENFQAGHFMSRRHYHTRWWKWNAHSQCPKCNLWGSGEQYSHSIFIDNWHWIEKPSIIIQNEAMKTDKIHDAEILAIIQHYYKECFEIGIDCKPKKQFTNTTND